MDQESPNIGTGSLMRVKAAAPRLGLSADHLRHLMSSRAIPYYKLKGAVFLDIAEIEQIIRSNRIPVA